MAAHPAPALLQPLARRLTAEHSTHGSNRDPDFIRRYRRVWRGLSAYFSPVVRGLDNLPRDGAVLVVGNHSTVYVYPDAWTIADALLDRRGIDAATYVLAFDLLFAMPGIGPLLRRAGAIPADETAAEAALAGGSAVLVFPGGDHDACRPWTDRDRIDFGSHRGFVRLALRSGVPVVPAVGYGAHHAVFVLARGEPFARAMGFAGVRVNVFPVLVGPPFGLTPLLTLPLPAQVSVEFLPALDWTRYGAAGADDPGVVEACHDEIVAAMQAAMDRLHAEHPHPVLDGAVALARHAASWAVQR
jgi:1-acyl-sn-glycerol-3-phosphate acyltransferase